MVGKTILGYHVDKKIGEGAYSTVYRVSKTNAAGTYVRALKHITLPSKKQYAGILNSMGGDYAKADDYFATILQDVATEIRILSMMSESGNPNIVRYYESDILENPSPRIYHIFILMEHLTPLPNYMGSVTLTVQDVIQLGKDVLNALILCHKHNVIHRDVKDENIFVSADGIYKLGDFGVSKALKDQSHAASIKGTPEFIAPEVYLGQHNYDHTVDIYSLGIVLYRLLNHFRNPFLPAYPTPFSTEDEDSAFAERMKGKTPPLPSIARNILGETIVKAILPRDQRYDSAEEFLCALKNAEKELVASDLELPLALSEVQAELPMVDVLESSLNSSKTIGIRWLVDEEESQADDVNLFESSMDRNRSVTVTEETEEKPVPSQVTTAEEKNETIEQEKHKRKQSKKKRKESPTLRSLAIKTVSYFRLKKQNRDRIRSEKRLKTIVDSNIRPIKEDRDAIFESGRQKIIADHIDEGFKYIQYAARNGSMDGAILLGYCYDIGLGVKQDRMVAEAYYRQGSISNPEFKSFYHQKSDMDDSDLFIAAARVAEKMLDPAYMTAEPIVPLKTKSKRKISWAAVSAFLLNWVRTQQAKRCLIGIASLALLLVIGLTIFGIAQAKKSPNKEEDSNHIETAVGTTTDTDTGESAEASNIIFSFDLSESKDGYVLTTVKILTEVTELIIPESHDGLPVIGIGDYVFSKNPKIESVHIPDSVIAIGRGAFLDCCALENVFLPKSVCVIEPLAFAGCTNLKKVEKPQGSITITDQCFAGCTNLTELVLPPYVHFAGDHVFAGVERIQIATMPADAITYIPNDRMTSVIINGGSEIPNHAFENCVYLKSIDLSGSNIVSIGQFAFYGCALESIVIPEGVTRIHTGAFMGCKSLKRVVLASTIQNIMQLAFSDCSSLETIEYHGSLSEWLNIGKSYNWIENSANYKVVYKK